MESDLKEALPKEFPRDAIIAALDEWWAKEQQDAALPGDPVPTPDIMKPAVEIDSHRAVRALLTIQEVVNFEIPESAIKNGGYQGIEEMKEHLVPRVQALLEKERKKRDA